MELIEHIPGGLRFQRGAGIGGPLKVVWVVLTTIPIAFAVGDSAGPLAGIVVAVAGVVAASAVAWQMVNVPVRYLEVDVRGGVMRQGELRDNVRHVERELPLSVVQRFCGIDRGGPGAAYSLGAEVARRDLTPAFFDDFSDGKLDLLWWTQESASTIKRMLKLLQLAGCSVDME